ncbi:hypothetical protein [Streptomonospora wellingtoniae]|uniref:Cupin domain-containing protein n=1 Tax=Streptomonospora wellingtoniae TaxID=3075544 RepID=A0ABU2KMV2_9ACTN|nr:hypothetical protein [Streptomonospora sp. DSM 45055]MDT0300585.1 hypothetical protein [Streptomonospora sp. DSM 45055]
MTYETAAPAATAVHPANRIGHEGSPPVPRPAAPTVSPEGIGDIVLAGQPAPYPHLQTRSAPTIGRLAAAARAAASVPVLPALRPRRRGRWGPAPRSVRRTAARRMRVSILVLEPNGFAAVPAEPRRTSVLHLASGRVHMVTVAPDREMQAVQELTGDRARALGSGDDHQLINTGGERAVVVRVTG